MAYLKPKSMKKVTTVIALSVLMLSGITIQTAPNARADSWFDDFTTSPDFDHRWTDGTVGQVLPDGESHAWAKSFDPLPQYPIADEDLPLWYGPSIRANISLSGDFTVSGKFNCVADVADFNVGKLEIQLLDSNHKIVHAIGWADYSNSTNAVSVYMRGQGGNVIYASDPGYSFSIFIGKTMSMVRSGGEIAFLIEGSEVFRTAASTKAINSTQVQFLRHKAGDIELMCTPNVMKLDSISVQTTPAEVPGKPGNLACSVGNGYGLLTWSAPADSGGIPVLNYRIYRGTISGAQAFLTSVGNVQSFNDTGLLNGNTYYYSISAENEAGEGERTGELSLTPRSLPSTPTNLQAIAGLDHVNLTWDAPALDGGADIIGYCIYRGLQPETISWLSTVGLLYSYSDFNVTSQKGYYYAVSASTAVGEGPFSETVEAVPGAPLSAPSEPRNLAALPIDSSVHLSWSAPSSTGNTQITNYSVYRGFNAGTVALYAVLGISLSFTDSGLSNGQKYYYALSASNAVGSSPLTEPVSATPIAPSFPSSPYNITLEPGDGQMLLRWQPPLDDGNSAIIGYMIYKGTDFGNLTTQISLGNVLTYTDTGLKSGQEYFYMLSSVNAVGEGVQSEVLSKVTILPESEYPDGSGNETSENSTGGWSLNSTIVTVAVLGVTVAIALLYFKKPNK